MKKAKGWVRGEKDAIKTVTSSVVCPSCSKKVAVVHCNKKMDRPSLLLCPFCNRNLFNCNPLVVKSRKSRSDKKSDIYRKRMNAEKQRRYRDRKKMEVAEKTMRY